MEEIATWVNVIVVISLIICFYFTLTFFENLPKGDERVSKQLKVAAMICFGIAFLLPLLLSLL
ncbi:hypothetical protein QNH47_09210 [Virgibacillus halodenitrificans]|uniref:hypothetical protein n=1 Tax=Virgibacillus halodenitrificans TaxID=1482 RepID=UPI0024C06E59|nr:hypothetical protein [Virgibacillus halodenitrificans]WHX28006.1 hypothetical protein QNH47_09210 [Virgibacillus halodenitrificans]